MRTERDAAGSFTLHLLDSSQGHAIQTWQFKNSQRVSIGRGADSDIRLADAQISRLHVELQFRDDRWMLLSHGRNVSPSRLPLRRGKQQAC